MPPAPDCCGMPVSGAALRLESLESRTLLAADTLAAIAGTAFVDLTDNGLTPDDTRLPNANVQLYRDGGNGVLDRGAGGGDDALVGSRVTDASGNYRFDDLAAATYFVEQPAVAGRLRRAGTALRQVVVTAQDADGVDGAPIDSYDVTTQAVSASSLGPTSTSSSIAAPESMGGERDLFVELLSGSGRVELLANAFTPNMLTFAADPAAVGRRVVTWDGMDGNGAVLSPTGLGGLDVTENGANVAIRLIMGADHDNGLATLYIYTNAANYSTASVPIPNTGTGAADERVIVPFGAFTPAAGSGADLTNVGAIQLEIEGVAAVDGQIDDLGMIGPTVLAANFPYVPPLSIGDLVWRDANNNGTVDNGENGVAGVTLTLYQDTDGNGRLTPGTDSVAGTATTAANGSYRFNNLMPGDYVVQVDPANFAGNGKLVGLVTSTGNQPTADPDNNVNNDDNGDNLAGAGVVAAAVTLTVAGEPTSDGDADPQSNLTVDFGFAPISDLIVIKSDDPDPVVAGENLTYTLLVTNAGPSPVTGVVVTDTLPAGVSFKSVTATQGSGSHQAGTVTVQSGQFGQRRDRDHHDRGRRAAVHHRFAAEPSRCHRRQLRSCSAEQLGRRTHAGHQADRPGHRQIRCARSRGRGPAAHLYAAGHQPRPVRRDRRNGPRYSARRGHLRFGEFQSRDGGRRPAERSPPTWAIWPWALKPRSPSPWTSAPPRAAPWSTRPGSAATRRKPT